MRRLRKGVRVTVTAVLVVGALLGLAALVLARTAPGRALVLRQMLDRAQASIQGELRVGEITSTGGLFTGFTLHNVSLSGIDGEPVVVADSAQVGYDLLSLFTTRTLSVRAYNPELSLERLEDGRWNLLAALESPRTATTGATVAVGDSTMLTPDSAGAPVDSTTPGFAPPAGGFAELQDVRLVNGTVRIEQSDGDWMVYDAIEAVIPEIKLGLGRGTDRAELSFLSMRGHFTDGLLDVRTLRGNLNREGDVVDVTIDRIELPESQGKGTARVDWSNPKDLAIDLSLDIRALALADLKWLNEDIPAGSGSGAVEAQLRTAASTASRWRFNGIELQAGRSELSGNGGLSIRQGRLVLESVDARARDLDLGLFEAWMPSATGAAPAWLGARVTGPVRMSGSLADLSVEVELDAILPGSEASVALELLGNLTVGNNPGATGLRVVARGVNLGELGNAGVAGGRGLPLVGLANIDARVDGRLETGISVTGDVLRFGRTGPSVLRVDGTISQTPQGWPVNGLVLLEPLLLQHVSTLAPAAELRGSVSGSVQLSGFLRDLTVQTDLDTSGGPLDLVARVSVFAPTSSVRMTGNMTGVDLSALSGRLPTPTELRGSMSADLSLRPSVMGTVEFDLIDSTLGSLRLHRTVFGGLAHDGVFEIDSLDLRTSALDVTGTGRLAIVDSLPAGEMQLHVSATSLEGLQPFLFGDSILVRDDLTDFELEVLEAEGVDTDTLPLARDVQVAGVAEGDFQVVGHLNEWTASGTIVLADAAYGRYEADSATVELSEFHWPSQALTLQARSAETRVWDRAYRSGEFDLGYDQGVGRLTAALIRSPDEDIRVRAGFLISDSLQTVNLDQATVRSGGERWNLGGPASASWGDGGLTVNDFRLVRPEPGGLRIAIDGTLPTSGEGDLRVSALDVDLERVAKVLQYEDEGIGGMLDLRLRMRGSPSVPLVNGTVEATRVSFRSVEVGRIGGDVRYANQILTGDLVASIQNQVVLSLQGTVPAALSFSPGLRAELVDAPIDVGIQADSVPLDGILGFFDGYEDIEGSVSGAVAITGRPDDLEPEGALTIANGASTIAFFGIRPEAFNGLLRLTPDGRVSVDARFRDEGVGRVTGIVDLNPISDPRFDLNITANKLRVVERRDIEGVVTGTATLEGSFTRPIIRGALTADEGTLFIDEFVRSAEVLDLSDPTLELRGLFGDAFDETEEAPDQSNPFVNNLLADVSLTLVRNTWLRSQRLNQSMNVELAGTLDMTFNRQVRSLVMLGELAAVRGTYTALGRNFSVEEGTVRFVGTPEVNPGLAFTADFRVPRAEGPLDIVANVGGTLLQPSFRLSSDDQALSESDLYSYLVFGQPTYALSTGQRDLVAGASVNLALGTIASQLGSFLLSEDIPIDYLDISTSQYFDRDFAAGPLSSEVRSTGVTVGKYVSDAVFLGVGWRPFGDGGANRNAFSGRLEWRFRDEWALEAFAEDRSLSDSFVRLGELGFDLSKVFGLFIFREWGY